MTRFMPRTRPLVIGAFAVVLSGCVDPANETPPALPEGAETVAFERMTEAEKAAAEIDAQPSDTAETKPTYWGVKEGEALTLMWEDLMPEGSEEQLAQEYEAFYAMLEQRYAANTTTLADAQPYGEIAEGSEFDFMPQLGNFDTVAELDGEHVRIPGYVVPFEFSSGMRLKEFLFVPYMGACIHTPPPPPNQIVFIRSEKPVQVKDIWAPYWIEGTLQTEKTENDIGDTAYALTLTRLEPYPMP